MHESLKALSHQNVLTVITSNDSQHRVAAFGKGRHRLF